MNKTTKVSLFFAGCSIIAGLGSCTDNTEKNNTTKKDKPAAVAVRDSLQEYVHQRIGIY